MDSSAKRFVDPEVAKRWIAVHGQGARSWLESLPDLVTGFADDWGLQIEDPLFGGSVSVVLSAKLSEEPVVLKLAAPWSQWAEAEAAALLVWEGRMAPRL